MEVLKKSRFSLTKWILEFLSLPFHKNTLYLMVNLLISFVFGVIYWMIAARLLSPAEVGTASAAIAPTNFLSLVFLMGANHSILRFNERIFAVPKLLFSLVWLTLGLSALGGVLSALLIFGVGFLDPVNGSLAISALAYLLIVSGTITNTICEAAFTAMGKPKKLIIRNLILGIFRTSLLAVFAGMGAFGFVLAFALGLGLAAVINLFLLVRHSGAEGGDFFTLWHPEIKGIIGFALPNHFANLLAGIPAMVLPIIVFKVLGAEMNGYFTLAWTISMIVRTLMAAASATLLAEGARDERLVGKDLGRSLLFLFLIAAISVSPMILFPKLILGFFGSAYTNSGILALPLLALSILPSVLITAFVAAERIKNRFKSILVSSLISGVLGSLLPWIGARQFGYEAFLIAYLFSQFMVGAYVLLKVKGQKLNINFSKVM